MEPAAGVAEEEVVEVLVATGVKKAENMVFRTKVFAKKAKTCLLARKTSRSQKGLRLCTTKVG